MTAPLIAPKPTCGSCRFTAPLHDLTKVVCHGAPPSAQIVGMTPAGPQIAVLRPNVERADPPCALHQPKAVQP